MGAVLKFEKKHTANMMNDSNKRAQVLNKIEERNLNKTVAKCDAEQKQLKRQIVEIREAKKVVMENVKHLTIRETQRKSQAKGVEQDWRFAQSKRKQKYQVDNKEDCMSCLNGKLESMHLQVVNRIPLDFSSNGDGIKTKEKDGDGNNETEKSKLETFKMLSSMSGQRGNVPPRRSSLPDISVLSRKQSACVPNIGSRATLPDSSNKIAAIHERFGRENCVPLNCDKAAEDISERRRCAYYPDKHPHPVGRSLPSIPIKSDPQTYKVALPRPSDMCAPVSNRLRERRRTIADLRPDLNVFARTQTSHDDNVKASRVLGAFRQLGHLSLGATIMNRRRHSLNGELFDLKAKQLNQVRYTDNPTTEHSDKSRLERESMKRQQEIADLNQKAWSLRKKTSR